LAKIAVSAAKTADRAAHTCQDEIERPFVFMTQPIFVEREFSSYEDLIDHDRESANSLNCNLVPRLMSALSPSRSSSGCLPFQVVWSPQRVELSHFSTAAQSELFDTDSENDPAQGQQMPGAFKHPPAPQAPVRYTCVQDPSEASLGFLLYRSLHSMPIDSHHAGGGRDFTVQVATTSADGTEDSLADCFGNRLPNIG
jgi:hypothetical protein